MVEKVEHFGRTWYGLLVLLALPTFLVLFPLLVGGQVPAWGDDLTHAAAYFAFWSRALHAGDSGLWNPENFGGFPLYATSFGFFAPWNYAIAALGDQPFDFVTVLPWLVLIAFVLGAFFTVKFLREFGIPFWPAYMAGIAYTLSHQTDAFLPVAVNYHVLLPLLFLIVWKLGKEASWWYVLWGSLVVSFGWLAVNFQETFYIFLIALIFAMFTAWWRWRSGAGSVLHRFVVQVFLVFVLGTTIGLIQILPSQLMADISTRAAGVSYVFAAEDPVLPTDFIRFVIPDVKLPQGIPLGSRGSTTVFYMGIIPLFFFLYALTDRSSFARFFKWLFWVIIATSIIYSPIFWLMAKLPVFSYFRVPDRWMIIAIFSAVVLAAFGAERFSRLGSDAGAERRVHRLFNVFLLGTGVILLGVLTLNAMFWFFEPSVIAQAKYFFGEYLYSRYQPQGIVPVDHYFGIIDSYFSDLHQYFSLQQPIVLAAVVSLAGSLGGLWLVIRHRARLGGSAAAILAILTVFNFITVKSFDYTTIPARTHAIEPSTISFLKQHPGRALPVLTETFEERTVRPTFRPDLSDRFQLRAAMLVPNTNLFYGIESAIIKDGLEPMAMSRLASLVGAPVIGIAREFPHNDPEAASRTLVERKPLLDFLGIRYLVSGYLLDERVFPKVFSGTVSSKEIPLSIYENREARPLISFADRVTFVRASEEEIFRRYRGQNFSGLFVDCASPCEAQVSSFGRGSAEITERKNTTITVRTASQEPTFLILSQNHLPGWRAFIDGVEAPRRTVNTVFLGLELPAGAHEVMFVYTNPCAGSGFARCLASLVR